MPTVRQRIFELLCRRELTALELSGMLGVREKEIYQHLDHVARSALAAKMKLLVNPSQCLKCGYLFRDRKRFTRPGRCPVCRNSHLTEPGFRVG